VRSCCQSIAQADPSQRRGDRLAIAASLAYWNAERASFRAHAVE
jgi:hypothetical protein